MLLYNWVIKVRKPKQTGFKSISPKEGKGRESVAKQSQQVEATAKASRQRKKMLHCYPGTILTHSSMVALPPSLLFGKYLEHLQQQRYNTQVLKLFIIYHAEILPMLL
jgi:hypothetical protein